jgi:diadenosine tetraphosphate (Ap4A) HIT family hydrolase
MRSDRLTNGQPPYRSAPCPQCGFELWKPIGAFEFSDLGLYDDARFPGRCILSLRPHYEQFDELPEHLRSAFMNEVAIASKAIRLATGANRVNMSILGNAEAHVHAHLIPRYPMDEERPNQSPWSDPRALRPLDAIQAEALRAAVRRTAGQQATAVGECFE